MVLPGASLGDLSHMISGILVCLQKLRIRVTARLSFRVRLPGLIFDLWAVPPKIGRSLGARQSSPRGASQQPCGVIPLGFRKPSNFPREDPSLSHVGRSH